MPFPWVRRSLGASTSGWRLVTGSERESIRPALWEMFVKSYGKIGLILKDPSGFDEFDVWDVHFGDDGAPNAFSLSKTTPYGIKRGLAATDRSDAGKRAYQQHFADTIRAGGVYGEVSHAVERIARLAKIPVVCARDAERILAKKIEIDPDGIHYTREIKGIGPVVKVMIGYPRTVGYHTTFDAPSCPFGLSGRRTAGAIGRDATFSPRVELAIEMLDEVLV